MDMVERVARAMEKNPGSVELIQGEAEHLARVAIEAMREPTDEMLAAADDAWVGADRAPPEIEYRMMIGSVLMKA